MSSIPKFLTKYIPTGYCNDEFPFDWQSLIARIIIKAGKAYRIFSGSAYARVDSALDLNSSIEYIERALASGRPFMAGKIGTADMEIVQRYMDKYAEGSCLQKWVKLLLGRIGPFWMDNYIRSGIGFCAGVFPQTDEGIDEFCRVFMDFCREFDAVPSWLDGERRVYQRLCPDAEKIEICALVPFGCSRTWYAPLAGKKVLVVHPYVKTIKAQYEKRVEFHKGQGVLPEFELIQYRPVNSIGGKSDRFAKWKDALDYMIADIEKIDFDIAILGCGVYGVPLSAHIKRLGRQAVYTGGATQLIFGIKGRRWDNYGIYNDNWVRVFEEDIPLNIDKIEEGGFL